MYLDNFNVLILKNQKKNLKIHCSVFPKALNTGEEKRRRKQKPWWIFAEG
jgi:hypothetical protein